MAKFLRKELRKKDKKSLPHKKKLNLDTNKCTICGGNKGGYTDDYFINKCYCADLRDTESLDWWEEQ